jgi:hypothetical protein
MTELMALLHGLILLVLGFVLKLLWSLQGKMAETQAQLVDAREEITRLRDRLNGVTK